LATEIVMPALGPQQDAGTLIAWLKDEGETVVQGEPLMEIETDKATVEVPAPASGILAGIRAWKGDEVPVGQTVGWILAPGEPVPGEMQGGQKPPASVPPAVAEGRALTPASPKARRLARERGEDLERLVGSGPGGAVLASDLPAPERARSEGGTTRDWPGQSWQLMAERVTQSWTSAPHFFLVREANAGRLMAWRAGAQVQIEPKLTYTDVLVKLAAAALSRHPRINASWSAGTIVLQPDINIGIAAAIEQGLVVPVIHRADTLTLSQIAARRQDLVRRAKTGKLTVEDLTNGTFTISNLGMYGVDVFLAILNPPQAAILAVGRIAERVVPIRGQPGVQPMMTLSLSCDHRVIDGAYGAQFLETLVRLIEEPVLLL
jgi:pyruvate dehydrogenase E2 component (dihydrolipoamide acetyltransferase)